MSVDYFPERSFLLKSMRNSLDFFERYSYDSEQKTYYSEISYDGKRISNNVHTVALSRLIYALAYSSHFYPEYLIKAEEAASFQLANLIGEDSSGPYFIPSTNDGKIDASDTLDIWQQAYGLTGLTELYRRNCEPKLLADIHRLHDAFLIRFQDQEFGGFYTDYSIKNGRLKDGKTIQSLIYPVSAYLANLWTADVNNRSKYQSTLAEHLRIALEKPIWNKDMGWVNTRFNRNWEVDDLVLQAKNYGTVNPGHNFQFAWLLMRAAQWDFISDENRTVAKKLGEDIVDITLDKSIWDSDAIGGFYEEIDPHTNHIVSLRKSWWQHAEAIIALSFVSKKHSKFFYDVQRFYFSNFSDFTIGGEYFYLDEKNHPVLSELKGSKGKSAYHHIEAIRFLIEGVS